MEHSRNYHKAIVILIIIAALIAVLFNLQSRSHSEINTDQSSDQSSQDIKGVVYSNATYGFSLKLPESWQGYTVTEKPIQYGNLITIRHPQWTADAPRMDIPILIYTTDQWNAWKANNFEGYPTAAPIGPTERAHNNRYFFATAPRYNFTFLTGFEEVEDLLQGLQGFDIK